MLTSSKPYRTLRSVHGSQAQPISLDSSDDEGKPNRGGGSSHSDSSDSMSDLESESESESDDDELIIISPPKKLHKKPITNAKVIKPIIKVKKMKPDVFVFIKKPVDIKDKSVKNSTTTTRRTSSDIPVSVPSTNIEPTNIKPHVEKIVQTPKQTSSINIKPTVEKIVQTPNQTSPANTVSVKKPAVSAFSIINNKVAMITKVPLIPPKSILTTSKSKVLQNLINQKSKDNTNVKLNQTNIMDKFINKPIKDQKTVKFVDSNEKVKIPLEKKSSTLSSIPDSKPLTHPIVIKPPILTPVEKTSLKSIVKENNPPPVNIELKPSLKSVVKENKTPSVNTELKQQQSKPIKPLILPNNLTPNSKFESFNDLTKFNVCCIPCLINKREQSCNKLKNCNICQKKKRKCEYSKIAKVSQFENISTTPNLSSILKNIKPVKKPVLIDSGNQKENGKMDHKDILKKQHSIDKQGKESHEKKDKDKDSTESKKSKEHKRDKHKVKDSKESNLHKEKKKHKKDKKRQVPPTSLEEDDSHNEDEAVFRKRHSPLPEKVQKKINTDKLFSALKQLEFGASNEIIYGIGTRRRGTRKATKQDYKLHEGSDVERENVYDNNGDVILSEEEQDKRLLSGQVDDEFINNIQMPTIGPTAFHPDSEDEFSD